MKLLIILNGECNDYEYLKSFSNKFDFIYCADGGYRHALKAGIEPDVVLGDFDSAEKPEGIQTLVFPAEKDETDTEIAIRYAKENGFEDITLTCALGGRSDHMLANILMLSRFASVKIEEKDCIIEFLTGNKILEGLKGYTVSLIPVEKSFVELSGFKYSLNDVIDIGTTLTVSNIVTADNAGIKIEYGRIILIITK